MDKIDLHVHTKASDGVYSPSEIVGMAADKKLKALAVADHDTVGGIQEAAAAAFECKIIFIPAVEISVEYMTGDFHLLGYFADPEHPPLLKLCAELASAREDRAVKMVSALAAAGYHIDLDYVMKSAEGGSVGKPHIARALVRAGYAADTGSVFKKFLEKGMPGYVPKKKALLEEALEALAGCGAVPVLAHPVSLMLDDESAYFSEINRFKSMGLRGIEVYASMHGKRDVRLFHKIAVELNLLVTGGSDFHGDKNEKLGYYGEGRPISAAILGPLMESGASASIMR
jgi:hypothetical protein